MKEEKQPIDKEANLCHELGGRVRYLKIARKKMKIYDYYYVDDTWGSEDAADENALVLTKRDEKLLFLKLFLDRAVGHEEMIKGWNYPFPFYQEFYVEKRITHWNPPKVEVKKLLKNINSPWRVYFFYNYKRDKEPYDYYIGIDTNEEKRYHQAYEKEVEEQLRFALKQCSKISSPTNVRLLSNVEGEFILYRSGNGSVDYDSKHRLLDHYVLVTNNRIYMGTLEYPRHAVLQPGRYRIVGRTVPSTGIFNELKIKISIKSAECLEVIEKSPLDNNYHKNLKLITSYKTSILDKIENEKVYATILWHQIKSNAFSFILFYIFSLIFIFEIGSAVLTVLKGFFKI